MPRNNPIFADKRGFLTAYAHKCGYMDTASVGVNKTAVRLYLDGTYHVCASPINGRPRVWDVFENRKDARKRFMALIRELGAVRKINKR